MVLPVTMPLVDYQENGIAGRFSDHIIPVFLGLTMVRDVMEPQEVEYLRKFEPIGCRDERTLNTVRRYGIKSYLNGCITVTFPRRVEKTSLIDADKKIYFVDVSKKFIDVMPMEITKNAEIRTHLINDPIGTPKAMAAKQYAEYIANARLVVTSLLHCAVPCMAAGIPVILIKEAVSYRMAWLEKLMPIYTSVSQVDWAVEPIELEDLKERVFSNAQCQLRRAMEQNSQIYDLSWYYEDRKKSNYINDACDSLKRHIDLNWTDLTASIDYSIWGVTQISEWLVDYIESRYPNAKLCHVYDMYRKVQFRGIETQRPEIIANYPDETVFVTTNGAERQARELFDCIGRTDDTFAIIRLVK